MSEEWRVIESHPAYAVSSFGRVTRIEGDRGRYLDGRLLSPATHRGGYQAVTLCRHDGKKTLKVHRLVCEAFHGPCPPDKECVAHRDGNPQNNRPENVYWATYKENAADKERHGTVARGDRNGARLHPERWNHGDNHWTRKQPDRVLRGDRHPRTIDPSIAPRGEKNHNAKLSDEAIRIIRATPKKHGSGRALAEKFGVSMSLISAVRVGRVWRHVA
jgi:hypothetical protein